MEQDQNSNVSGQITINPLLLNPEVQQWIRQNTASIEEIAFAPLPFDGIHRQELLQQVEGYRKTLEKLPQRAKTPGLLFPVKISLEQCSSQATAQYKAANAARHLGGDLTYQESKEPLSQPQPKIIADLTGGFGVDTYYFSQVGARVHHFELDESLSSLVAHNLTVLEAAVLCHHGDGLQGLKTLGGALDLIYLDPARRDAHKNKVFRLEDCSPDVLKHLDYLLECSPNIMLKTSPMLDLNLGLKQLKKVTEIHVVAINNEVKEILWLIQKSAANAENPRVFAVNLNNGNPLTDETAHPGQDNLSLSTDQGGIDCKVVFDFNWNRPEQIRFSTPQSYLYEPNAPLRKIGQYAALTEDFPVLRIGPNAHLFTSEQLLEFPGRVFKVMEHWPYAKRHMKVFKGQQYNITTRDFPQTVAKIRAEWQIKEGGDQYLFFTTDAQGTKWIILCHKAD